MSDNRVGYDTDGLPFTRDEYRQSHGLPPQVRTVSELIEVLRRIEAEHGDIPVENHYIGLTIAPTVRDGERVEL